MPAVISGFPQGQMGCLLAIALSLVLVVEARASMPAHLRSDVTVGAADHPVHLKAGDSVELISQTGTKAIIMVTLPTGDKGIYQIDAEVVELSPVIAPPAPTPATTTVSVVHEAAPSAPAAPAIPDDKLPEDQISLLQVRWPETTPLPGSCAKNYKAQAGSYSNKLYCRRAITRTRMSAILRSSSCRPTAARRLRRFRIAHAKKAGWW